MTVGHNPPVSGVAAFGSQDLGFRTSIFGPQDLGFRTSIFGPQDLGFRTSLACVSPPPQPAAPKCNRGRFCHRIVVSDRRTHGLREFIYKILTNVPYVMGSWLTTWSIVAKNWGVQQITSLPILLVRTTTQFISLKFSRKHVPS